MGHVSHLCQEKRWDVGIWHVSVIGRIFFASQRKRFRLLFIEPTCFLLDLLARCQDIDVSEHFRSCK